jgi:hypothetical protein
VLFALPTFTSHRISGAISSTPPARLVLCSVHPAMIAHAILAIFPLQRREEAVTSVHPRRLFRIPLQEVIERSMSTSLINLGQALSGCRPCVAFAKDKKQNIEAGTCSHTILPTGKRVHTPPTVYKRSRLGRLNLFDYTEHAGRPYGQSKPIKGTLIKKSGVGFVTTKYRMEFEGQQKILTRL